MGWRWWRSLKREKIMNTLKLCKAKHSTGEMKRQKGEGENGTEKELCVLW